MKRLIKELEDLYALFLILIYRLIPKVKADSKKGLIFADMGIGDFLMFLPVIKYLFDNKYDLTFKCERAEIIEIIKGIFPQSRFISPYRNYKFIGYSRSLKYYKFHFCIVNFHMAYKWNIMQIIRLRIPVSIGHSWKENKYHNLFTHPIEYIKTDYEPNQNMRLLEAFSLDYFNSGRMFFKTESFDLPFENYILIQTFSHTQLGKNCWYPASLMRERLLENIILIGSIEEKDHANNIEYLFRSDHIVNLCGKLNIFQTAFLIKNSKEFHCNEGGLAHIAYSVDAKNIFVHYNKDFINSTKSNFHLYNKNIKYIES